jgi:hypothetical protein
MLGCADRLQLNAMVSQKLRDIFGINTFRLFFLKENEKGEPVLDYYKEMEVGNKHYQKLSVVGYKGIAGYTA